MRPLSAVIYMSILVGLNDGNLAMVIPQFKKFYNVPDEAVATLFLYCSGGFLFSASINGYMVKTLGQRTTLYVGSISALVAYVLILQGFPFKYLGIFMILQGAGIGLVDSAMNVFTANVPYATVMLNILHAVYGLGAMISPIVGTWILANDMSWKGSYVFLAGAAVINLILITIGFYKVPMDEEKTQDTVQGPIKDAFLHKMTMTGAFYILVYVGLEVTLGSWGYLFLTEGRGGKPVPMGHVMSGYWFGLASGRIVLGYIASKYGEKYIITLATISTAILLGVFGYVKEIAVDATALIIIGFLLGPMFPTTIALASRVLPRWMHASAIGFMASFGAGGAAFFPFITGQISGWYGILSLPLTCLVMSFVMQLLWVFVPSDRPMFPCLQRPHD
ncbi:major facilitator superfamily domain-containing protein [Phycomyces nitens]|nr:major facilitator superfamily domain-containing protein [Phycomyces nitens]